MEMLQNTKQNVSFMSELLHFLSRNLLVALREETEVDAFVDVAR